MPVDIETELVQLWAGSRSIAGLLRSKLPAHENRLTISTIGLRPGRDHQIAGLAQILQLSQSFTLEIAIKTLHRNLYSNSNPPNTYDLSKLFNSLHKDVKTRLSSTWEKIGARSLVAQNLTLDEFLKENRLLFEKSRYLYERSNSYTLNTKDFDMAIWVITDELIKWQHDSTVLYNLYNMLSEELGGLELGSVKP